jgi:hypothetical protein
MAWVRANGNPVPMWRFTGASFRMAASCGVNQLSLRNHRSPRARCLSSKTPRRCQASADYGIVRKEVASRLNYPQVRSDATDD